jgi:hypothetical protein
MPSLASRRSGDGDSTDNRPALRAAPAAQGFGKSEDGVCVLWDFFDASSETARLTLVDALSASTLARLLCRCFLHCCAAIDKITTVKKTSILDTVSLSVVPLAASLHASSHSCVCVRMKSELTPRKSSSCLLSLPDLHLLVLLAACGQIRPDAAVSRRRAGADDASAQDLGLVLPGARTAHLMPIQPRIP